jgi:5-methylcytosine-specific restriction endonuclease McrA
MERVIKFERYHCGPITSYDGRKFNKDLKYRIKLRDKNQCQLCSSNKNLHVHHINYDKANVSQYNLITLCKTCHLKTNIQRRSWMLLFQDKIKTIYESYSITLLKRTRKRKKDIPPTPPIERKNKEQEKLMVYF